MAQPRMLSKSQVIEVVREVAWPALKAQKDTLDNIDKWWRFSHDPPHQPRVQTIEYRELSARAQTPWLSLVVTAVAQSLYVEGYRSTGERDNAAAWDIWQGNRMDARQIAIHRAALAYGQSFATVLPGLNMFGEPMPRIDGVSPREMVTFYLDPAADEWPASALRADPARIDGNQGWRLRYYDEVAVHELHADAYLGKLVYVTFDTHDVGVCPVIRFANMLDLEGRTDGEVEPFISVAGRIDQTTFDRLVVQRFASWVVRTIAGMAMPENATPEGIAAEKLRLMVSDILVAADPDTKFGSLPASELGGFIAAKEADVHDLAAVSQTPPHYLLGQMANLSAEALMAAETSLSRKVMERKHSFGESHEQMLRLGAHIAGDEEGARDFEAEVKWRDIESKLIAQAADALGKLATMLGVPVELLWSKIPGFTQQDVDEARALAAQPGGIDALLAELTSGGRLQGAPPNVPAQP